MTDPIGEPFDTVETSIAEALGGVGQYLAVVNDPPWSTLAATLPPPAALISARDMEIAHLDSLVPTVPDTVMVLPVSKDAAP